MIISIVIRLQCSGKSILRFNLSDLSGFALVKDSGLRRKTQDLGKIILNGMMPKGATAEAQDVTEAYAYIDFSTRLESDERKEKKCTRLDRLERLESDRKLARAWRLEDSKRE